MQHRSDQPERDAWFVYSRRAGGISARPITVRGWIALGGCVALTLLVGMTVSGRAFRVHPLVGALAVMIVVLIGVALTIGLAVAKGRRID
jgi:hypothetical protein